MTQKEKLILVEYNESGYAVITLNRPQMLNALSIQLLTELVHTLQEIDQDDNIKVAIITGSAKAFAAGADISELADMTAIKLFHGHQFATWDALKHVRTPLIAAVSGYALGGGFELVMACDIIIASETSMFGQPEINLGVIPGAGGTQRLTRQVGKYIAMEMILNGRLLTAPEALHFGLVNRVVPVELYLDEARELAAEIAKRAPLALILAKDAILKAEETSLTEGLDFERQNFYLLFGTEDQKEGMKAFLEKRPPNFKGK